LVVVAILASAIAVAALLGALFAVVLHDVPPIKPFFRLVQQAVAVDQIPYARLVRPGDRHRPRRHKGLGSP
jgi:hypothetical protein